MKTIFITLILALQLFSYEQKLKNYLDKKFSSYYPTMTIKSIEIKANNTIPKGYKLKKVYFSKNSIKRENGNFSAIFSDGESNKRIYFKYFIDASVQVLLANIDIRAKTPLSMDFFTQIPLKFDNFYDKPVTDVYKLEAKTLIVRGKILTSRMVRKIPDIHRNDEITAEARDGSIVLDFPVRALEDGRVGEVIKVKRGNKKILKAKVISSNKVLIK